MTTRTTSKTVTFDHSFFLVGLNEELPAGTYTVETDEDLLEGLSFTAYRRSLTVIHLPQSARHPGRTRSLEVSPEGLDAALERDRVQNDTSTGNGSGSRPSARSQEEPDRSGVLTRAEARAENEGMAGNAN